MTVEAWETVRSTRTPSTPITIPATSSPCSERLDCDAPRYTLSSEAAPLRWAIPAKAYASPAAISRLTAVPSQAAIAFAPSP
jgi:hypothetical protein